MSEPSKDPGLFSSVGELIKQRMKKREKGIKLLGVRVQVDASSAKDTIKSSSKAAASSIKAFGTGTAAGFSGFGKYFKKTYAETKKG